MSHLLSFIFLLLVIVNATFATIPLAEVYWNTVLPDTAMPTSIYELLHPTGEKVQISPTKSDPPPSPIPPLFGYNDYAKDNSETKTVAPPPSPIIPSFNYGYTKNERSQTKIDTSSEINDQLAPPVVPFGYDYQKKKIQTKNDPPPSFPFGYNYAKKEPQMKNDPPPVLPFGYNYEKGKKVLKNEAITGVFFLQESLIPGSKLNFIFPPANSKNTLLPRKIADLIPLSSEDLPLILSLFSINPSSNQAQDLITTLNSCESPTIPDEVKACVSSLESMVEFAMSVLQTREISAMSSDLPKRGLPKNEYTISKVKQIGFEANYVACHDEIYPYKLFRCHTTGPSRAYVAMMSAKDGTTIELVSICHVDTSMWNPNHLSFQVLGVKPGTVPVCHIMPYGHILWGPKKTISQL
ncbi:hypothetical protein LUZ60_003295 [Juncus effusus]|nr:hypothetical protein LUZ60_003295 [Juncus effusus]